MVTTSLKNTATVSVEVDYSLPSEYRACNSSVMGIQQQAAAMTLIQSTKLNGHNPLAYLGDILERLPTQPNYRVHELLPHHWQPAEQ